jgi:aspartyl/glutamyl-tRNA(Asn/Gln) amidotransferase C subunit
VLRNNVGLYIFGEMPACARAVTLVKRTAFACMPRITVHNRFFAASGAPSGRIGDSVVSSNVEPPNIEQLAELARVGVSEQEALEWAPKISSILDWFGQLGRVDLEGVPPALRAEVDGGNLLRPDTPAKFENMWVGFLAFGPPLQYVAQLLLSDF